MKRIFATIFAPHDIAMDILTDERVIDELRNDDGHYAVTWNEGGVYDKCKSDTIVIAFVPEKEEFTIPNFFSKVARNPMCFVFTERKVYGLFIKKARTPSKKETHAVISREQFTTERIIETIKFMRKEFP